MSAEELMAMVVQETGRNVTSAFLDHLVGEWSSAAPTSTLHRFDGRPVLLPTTLIGHEASFRAWVRERVPPLVTS